MKFVGLHPRTRWVRWGLLGVALGIVIGTTGPRALDALVATWETNRAMLPWVFERLFAFLAYFAMTGSVIYGLLLSTKILDVVAHRPITFTLHQDLACIGLGLAAVHGMLLALDKTVPFTLAQIAVPGMSPHAPIWVAAGQVAFYLMAIVVGSFYFRRQIGQRAWRVLHYLTFLAFIGATLHGVLAGTDSSSPWAWWIYVGSMVAVVFLLVYRISLAVGRSRTVPRSAVAAQFGAQGGPSAR
jgi:sulfoxide reductase heme-binding subunit YedZ